MGKVIEFKKKVVKEPEWLRRLKMIQEALIEFEEESGTEKRKALRQELYKERAKTKSD